MTVLQRGIKTSDTTNYGASKGVVIGADFDGTSNSPQAGYIDELRIEKGVAKYTAAFTAPTAVLTGDADTKLLLHFDGSAGITTTTDDVIRNQDIRITKASAAVSELQPRLSLLITVSSVRTCAPLVVLLSMVRRVSLPTAMA